MPAPESPPAGGSSPHARLAENATPPAAGRLPRRAGCRPTAPGAGPQVDAGVRPDNAKAAHHQNPGSPPGRDNRDRPPRKKRADRDKGARTEDEPGLPG